MLARSAASHPEDIALGSWYYAGENGVAARDAEIIAVCYGTPGDSQNSPARSFDGSNNSEKDTKCGAENTVFTRLVRNSYPDGRGDKSPSEAFQERPNPRDVSRILFSQPTTIAKNRYGLSSMVWQWGQFIDHDITLTPEEQRTPTGDMVDISNQDTGLKVKSYCPQGSDISIKVNPGDFFLDPLKKGGVVIHQCRSARVNIQQVRESRSGLSMWIDGSTIYGLQEETDSECKQRSQGKPLNFDNPCIRKFELGLLQTSQGGPDGELLPIQTVDQAFGWQFKAGDGRVNEQVGLTSMHTLWVREHNFIARRIHTETGTTDDQKLFSLARQEVIAEIQAITFNEWLPALLGENFLNPYNGYIIPQNCELATTEFATSIFRFGHSMVPDDLQFETDNGESRFSPIQTTFFQPNLVRHMGIDGWLRGLTVQEAEEIDTKVVDGLRNSLFEAPGFPSSFSMPGRDLVALNIQRGRDHGIGVVQDLRRVAGLGAANLETLTSNRNMRGDFQDLYGTNVNRMDPFVFLLAEDHDDGARVGPTLRRLLKLHFERLRDNDRFWYENTPSLKNELPRLKATTLGQVLSRNTKLDLSFHSKVFYVPN
eukprot:gb/GEZN01001116.1/.p1 GENE.gb/GEZN01001116.1/~~gb/GEZN01001116.1/.p1  ORF type:complete len:597 (-),score=45.00 gb/GEZN01001116.1/:293-2083(-)